MTNKRARLSNTFSNGTPTSQLTVAEAIDLITACPEGVPRARDAIMSLALRGGLSDQTPSGDSTTLAGADDRPPCSWPSRSIDSVMDLVTDGEHLTPPRIGTGIPLVTAKNVRDGYMDIADTDFVSQAVAEKCWRRCAPREGDVLMVCVGATTGRVCVLPKMRSFVLVRSVALLRPDTSQISAAWLVLFLRSPEGQRQIWAGVKEQAQPCLYINRMKTMVLPLPPLAEQKRIVAKVDQLMALCDDLEAKQNKKRDLATQSTLAALAALPTAETPADLALAWQRLEREHSWMWSISGMVDQFKKTILDLAARGLLTSAGGAADPGTNDGPFLLVKGWRWLRLEALASHFVDCLHSTPRCGANGYPSIRTADVVPGRLMWRQARLVDEKQFAERVRRLAPREGDILYSREGERLGIAACVPPGVRLCLGQRMMHIRVRDDVDSKFVMWILNSPVVYSQAVGDTGGSTSPHVNMKDIRQFWIPVPEPNEQRRIVVVVERLMSLLDDLEAKLRKQEETATRLAESLAAAVAA